MSARLVVVPNALPADKWGYVDGLLKRGCELFVICDVLRADHGLQIGPCELDLLLWRRLGARFP